MKNQIFLRAKSALLFVSLLFTLALFANKVAFSQSFQTGDSEPFYKTNFSENILTNLEDDEYEIFELVNNERRKRRLADLEWDERLAQLAQQFSRQMASQNFFSHHDREGRSVVDRANAARIKGWSKIGENLFYCEENGNYNALAIKGWMKSAGHRQNILDNAWTSTGIGVAFSRTGRIYVTQIFIQK